ncbi:MAG: TetR/AcrR family transcriptional regulator [Lachnospiraceae bacterium]|nr:TetR/AcrR family transcriptional regulator [Lachnospiraceae bacterium]
MENFINPHAKEQTDLINAAMSIFAQNGYKKASVADICAEAGLAKGMINYYFGSKKNLYLYLAELSGKKMFERMERDFDASITDFFDNMKMMTKIKLSMMKEHPAIFAFLTSFYMEQDKDVRDEIKEYLQKSLDIRKRFIFDDIDISRFKDDVNAGLIDQLLVWAGEGMANNLKHDFNPETIEKYTDDLFACLDLMKKYFYRRRNK